MGGFFPEVDKKYGDGDGIQLVGLLLVRWGTCSHLSVPKRASNRKVRKPGEPSSATLAVIYGWLLRGVFGFSRCWTVERFTQRCNSLCKAPSVLVGSGRITARVKISMRCRSLLLMVGELALPQRLHGVRDVKNSEVVE